jgi:hypothetical protein
MQLSGMHDGVQHTMSSNQGHFCGMEHKKREDTSLFVAWEAA